MLNRVFFIFVLFLFCSCRAYKEVAYFKNLENSGVIDEQINNYNTLKIQKDDLLAINVSSIEPKAAAIYNIGNDSNGQGASTQGVGYLVDQNGEIQIPTYGNIKVSGLTTAEARKLIVEKLSPFLGKPVVSLKLLNFKFSVLGDVAGPGVYAVEGERITLVEALSKAGDLTITGIRKNVLLVREIEGTRKYVRLDLNDKEIFNSPYYYLQPNDIIYVQPSNAKYATVDNNFRYLGIVLSSISIILVIITQFK